MEPRPRRRTKKEKQQSPLSPLQKGEVSRIARTVVTKNLEKKYLLTGVFGATTAAYVMTSLCDVPVGTTDSSRIGDTITVRNLSCYLNIEEALPNLLSAHYIRAFIFQFVPQFSVTPPTGANTRLNDPVAGGVSPRSFLIVDGRELIRPLWQKDFVVDGNLTAGGQSSHIATFNVNLSSAKKNIQFVGGSTTDAYSKIFFGIISSSGTTSPNFAFSCKLDYTDA